MADVLSNISRTNYNARKAATTGLIDIALFLSNVAQLKSLLREEAGATPLESYFGISLICVSLLIQTAIGVLIIMLLNAEGAIIHMRLELSPEDEITVMETTPESDREEHTALIKQIWKKQGQARRINTSIMIFVFFILVLNLIINGLELGTPSGEEQQKKLLESYNATLP